MLKVLHTKGVGGLRAETSVQATPAHSQVASVGQVTGPIQINTLTRSISALLAAAGIQADTIPFPSEISNPDLTQDGSRDKLRRSWGADGRRHVVVALLSDHPSLADAVDAATITALAGATLINGDGEPVGVTLLVHPDQKHRQRAQDFLAYQAAATHVLEAPHRERLVHLRPQPSHV